MTEYTDRAAAVTAALQDLARNLEADLGKLARNRGGGTASTSSLAILRDPGPNLASFAQQKIDNPSTRTLTVDAVLRSYSAAADQAKAMVHANAPAGDDLAARTAVLNLIAAIQNVTNHDDAVALVATYTGGTR